MRILLWLAIGFGTGSALCAYLLPRDLLLAAALCAVLLGMGAGVLGKDRKALRRLALMLVGIGMAMGWFRACYSLYLDTAITLDGETAQAVIQVSDYGYDTGYGTGADGEVRLEGRTYRIRFYLDGQVPLEPGDRVEGTFRFRVTVPEGKEPASYLGGRGIFLLLYQTEGVFVEKAQERELPDWIAMLRRRLNRLLRSCFPGDTEAFARALLLGETYDLSYETRTDLKISGIWHVVSVSGLHVSILFALVSVLTLKNRWLTPLLGLPLLLFFAALAGFSPSVTRSCIMCGLMMLAMLTLREYDGGTALAFAVLVMLLANPLTVTDVGFQLSVGSVAGIFLFSGSIRKWILGKFRQPKGLVKKLINWLASAVSVSLSAVVFTTPLCALYFGTVSLIGVVTNLLTLWAVTAAFYGILGVCALYGLWSAGAGILAQGVSVLLRYVLRTAGLLAEFPLAAVYTRSGYIALWLVFVYVLLLLFLVGKREPKVLACCAGLGLCMALAASWLEPMTGYTRLTVLDVGQGQCLVFQDRGRTYMVDCGGDDDWETADRAAEFLLRQGIRRLDGLIITHSDRDHAGGAAYLLTRVETELLVLPPDAGGLENTGGRTLYAEQILELCFSGTVIRIYPATFPGNSNETSLCVLFDSEKCDILVTGDRTGFGERMLLRTADIPQVDVLIAGHHGAAGSTCAELLAQVQPETVCISVSGSNPYGHPAAELLERLRGWGCTVYRTDRDGDITIRR